MAKEELLTLEGVIDEILPDGRFGVMLENEHRIIAYTAGKMRKFRIRSVVGDRVHVEMTPYDLSKDPRYAGIAIPNTESLKDTIARVLPYWEGVIAPELKAGKTVLISAHGNSLRALVKHLSGLSDADITGLEIPTGQPIVYELDDALNATDRYYLSER